MGMLADNSWDPRRSAYTLAKRWNVSWATVYRYKTQAAAAIVDAMGDSKPDFARYLVVCVERIIRDFPEKPDIALRGIRLQAELAGIIGRGGIEEEDLSELSEEDLLAKAKTLVSEIEDDAEPGADRC